MPHHLQDGIRPPSYALLVFSILSPDPICPEHNNHLGFGSGLGLGFHEQFFVLVTAFESNSGVAMRQRLPLGGRSPVGKSHGAGATEQILHLECSSTSQTHPEGLRGAANFLLLGLSPTFCFSSQSDFLCVSGAGANPRL